MYKVQNSSIKFIPMTKADAYLCHLA